ncbi:Ig-like domain-containing protein [Turneriella parva]|uniref:Ig-like domain-containing protein n=1 Tax=Turneriella parva TaxID=29510 RepID=UPI0002D2732F|nr:Ig-like domain-containing protein [Turneriella parva]
MRFATIVILSATHCAKLPTVNETFERALGNFRLGGAVVGLAGQGLTLSANGGSPLAITQNGSYQFDVALRDKSPYAITIAQQPQNPKQTCTLSNASGVLQSEAINNVDVNCVSAPFRVGGTVLGLIGGSVKIQLNASEELTLSANGTFQFTQTIADGTMYNVQVTQNPGSPAQTCSASKNKANVRSKDVTDVAIVCATQNFTIGGFVAGLTGSGLKLSLNGGPDLTAAAGFFTFPQVIADNSAFNVQITTQPTNPAQTCTVSNNQNILQGGNITNVQVQCGSQSYAVSGTVTGLVGQGFTLQINGGSELLVGANGAITFPAMADGSAYNVQVLSQPTLPTQVCGVVNNKGTIAGAAVTDVQVICSVQAYQISGYIAGLSGGTVTLVNNENNDEIMNVGNGFFNFARLIPDGSAYSVAVKNQPLSPLQFCSILNSTGAISGGSVGNIFGYCQLAYQVGGTVTGLAGQGLALQINGTEIKTIATNGSYNFTYGLPGAATYSVQVLNNPKGLSQTCVVTNGFGTMPSSAVSNVNISCTTDYFAVTGTVRGLAGNGLTLQNNGANDVVLNTTGADINFAFATQIDGSGYDITILNQPSSPPQNCIVSASGTSASGTVSGGNKTGLLIDCAPDAPGQPDLLAADDSGSSDSDNITNRTTALTFQGNAEANSTVTLMNGATQIATTTANGSGFWQVDVNLTEAVYNLTARATNAAGFTSADSPALLVTVDVTAPLVPTIPDLQDADDTGTSVLDDRTNVTTNLTFTGNGESGQLVQLLEGATILGSGLATGGTYTIDLALAAGIRNITARVMDAAGNISGASLPLSVTIDTTAPTVALSYNQSGNTTGPFAAGSLTVTATYSEAPNGTPNITVDQPGSSDVTTAMLPTANPLVFTYTYTVTADNGGAFQDGTATVSLSATTDTAGNSSQAPTNASFGIATAGPAITSAVLANSNAYIDVTFSSGVYTNSGPPSGAVHTGDFLLDFSANAGPASGATISSVKKPDNTVEASASALTGGETVVRFFLAITCSPPVPCNPSGAETINIRMFDANSIYDLSNNPAKASVATGAKFLFDKKVPTITAVTPNTVLKDSNVGSVSVSITFSEAMDTTFNPSQTLTVGATPYTITGSSWSVGNTVWTGSFAFTDLNATATGSYTISGFRDIASNVIATNTSYTINVDTQNPVFSAVAPANSASANTTAVSYTLSEALQAGTVTWTRTGGSTDGSSPHTQTLVPAELASGTFSGVLTNPPTLVSGAVYTITFNGSDANGNAAPTVTRTGFTFDTSKPTVSSVSVTALRDADVGSKSVSITFSEAMNTAVNPSPTITGLASAYTITGSAWSVGNTVWTGAFTFIDNNEAATGTYNISTFQDAQGNVMNADTARTVTVDTRNPAITGRTLHSQNNYIDVTFDQGVYTNSAGAGALIVSDLVLTFTQNGGGATAATIASVTKTTGSALTGGETTIRCNLSITGTATGVETITVRPAASQIFDSVGNAAPITTVTASINLNPGDILPPTITLVQTLDSNGNGRIDAYKITFSENIVDSSFPGFTANNNLGTVTTAWLVAGYTNVQLAHGTTAPTGQTDVLNDNVIYLKFSEFANGYDTGAKPDLTTTASPGVKDLANNTMAQLFTATVTESDTAAPIITAAEGTVGYNRVWLAFSEAVDNSAAIGCLTTITQTALSYNNIAAGGATAVSATPWDDENGCDALVRFNTNANLLTADANGSGDRVGAASATAIYDAAGNAMTTTQVSLTASAGVFTALYPTNGLNWMDYIRNNGTTVFNANSTACTGSETGGYYKCLHGGAMRVESLPTGNTDCTGVTAIDSLDAFNWVCDTSTNPVRMVSTALNETKNLSDLIDWGTCGGTDLSPCKWKQMTLRIFRNGNEIKVTPPRYWAANNIVRRVVSGIPVSLNTSGTIHVIMTNTDATFSISAKNALVVQSGSKVANTTNNPVVGGGSADFSWIEGEFEQQNTGNACFRVGGKFQVVRNASARGLNSPSFRIQTSADNVLLFNTAVGYSPSSENYLLDSPNYATLTKIRGANTTVKLFDTGGTGSVIHNALGIGAGSQGIAATSGINVTVLNSTVGMLTGAGFTGSATNGGGVLMNFLSAQTGSSGITQANTKFSHLNIAAAHAATSGVLVQNTAAHYWGGLLRFGSNTGKNCDTSATTATLAGLVDTTCANGGASDATFTSGITMAGTFVGRVTTNDAVNTSDTNGTAPFASGNNWLNFANDYRLWGKDGTAITDSTTRGSCTSGTCRIWDMRLTSTDTGAGGAAVAYNVNALPYGNQAYSHAWYSATAPTAQSSCDNYAAIGSTFVASGGACSYPGYKTNSACTGATGNWSAAKCVSTFIPNATEFIGDGVGNENGLCESNEVCLFTPNIGAYQGEETNPTVNCPAGTTYRWWGKTYCKENFIDGTVAGVTLLRFDTNGIDGSGNPVAWTPRMLPISMDSVRWWLDASQGAYSDAGATLASNGQTVQQWNDQSGGARHGSSATAGNRPTYVTGAINGRPVLRFDGTSDQLSFNGNFFLNTAYTLIVVAKITSNKADNWFLAGDTNDANAELRLGFLSTSSFQLGQGSNSLAVTESASGNADIYLGSLNTSTGRAIRKNGTLLTSDANTSTVYSYTNSRIGRRGAGFFFQGDIAEIIAFNKELSQTEREMVQCYLGKKYSIALSHSCP